MNTRDGKIERGIDNQGICKFMSQLMYVGTELKLFSKAQNWKNYIRILIAPYIKGDVLEVGAGIGTNTCLLCLREHRKWLCLEPDINLFLDLKSTIVSCDFDNCYLQNGTLDTLTKKQFFDSILYLDVLEHIYKDKDEIIRACHHLEVEGHLIVLAPAYQWLFTPFDTAIGHYRRYSKSKLIALLPDSIEVVRVVYLDCVGLLANLANKLLLRQRQPMLFQLKLWDNLMVPLSKGLDPILGYNFGKTILLIGRKKC
jgi:hypothetical protein